LIAVHGAADLESFEQYGLGDPRVAEFGTRVRMVLDDEANRLYPQRWIGKIRVTTRDGRALSARVDEPKGDPGNTLSRDEIETKAVRLARFRGGATEPEMRSMIARIWELDRVNDATGILPQL
jgi:2-methylcitrate dehydratase PrpD